MKKSSWLEFFFRLQTIYDIGIAQFDPEGYLAIQRAEAWAYGNGWHKRSPSWDCHTSASRYFLAGVQLLLYNRPLAGNSYFARSRAHMQSTDLPLFCLVLRYYETNNAISPCEESTTTWVYDDRQRRGVHGQGFTEMRAAPTYCLPGDAVGFAQACHKNTIEDSWPVRGGKLEVMDCHTVLRNLGIRTFGPPGVMGLANGGVRVNETDFYRSAIQWEFTKHVTEDLTNGEARRWTTEGGSSSRKLEKSGAEAGVSTSSTKNEGMTNIGQLGTNKNSLTAALENRLTKTSQPETGDEEDAEPPLGGGAPADHLRTLQAASPAQHVAIKKPGANFPTDDSPSEQSSRPGADPAESPGDRRTGIVHPDPPYPSLGNHRSLQTASAFTTIAPEVAKAIQQLNYNFQQPPLDVHYRGIASGPWNAYPYAESLPQCADFRFHAATYATTTTTTTTSTTTTTLKLSVDATAAAYDPGLAVLQSVGSFSY